MRENESGAGGAGERPWREFKPGTQVAGFTVEAPISSGSFGTVYRASRGGRAFAIKVVPLDSRGDREVDALRRIRHPHVVRFQGYGLWPDDEPRFIVLALDFVEGRALDVWMRERNPTALELVRQVLLPCVRTLGAVHAAGVVHRDVKESNILIRDSDGEPVLVDFGAAGFEGAQRLTAVLPPGTPEYRSPEAWRFVRESESPEPYPAGPGDDLWALGVVLYFLLTGTLPFGDRQSPGMVHAVLHAIPRPPLELNPRVPPALSELCLRMLEKAPEARYASAEALEEALEEVAALGDDAWNGPLLPGGQQQVRARVPVPRSRGTPGRWFWIAAVALPAAWGAGLLFLPPAPRREPLPLLPPTHQAGSSQEIAPFVPTKDVDVEPPVASATKHKQEDPLMTRSKKARSVTAACMMAGSACVSAPPPRPTLKDCPPGTQGTYERFHLEGTNFLLIPPTLSVSPVEVREGEIHNVELGLPWGTLPEKTLFSGRLFFAKDQVYGLFTRAHLPGGEIVPICIELTQNGPGTPMLKESTSKKVFISASIGARLVR